MQCLKYIILPMILILLMSGCRLSSPISPGELASVHVQLEGTSNCTQCHILGKKVSDEKCLACHTAIGGRIKENKGYHASDEVLKKKCYECHSDHHGRDFDIIHFDTTVFDHNLTGYILKGSHASLFCSSCHKGDFIKDTALLQRDHTYLGLTDQCLNCHQDQHRGMLSSNCFDCHNYKNFSPASLFDHNKVDFTLNGAHALLECDVCHGRIVIDGVELQQFTGLDFENCNACHEDVHQSKFGNNCVSCHSENSFKKIKNLAEFDHGLTDYDLQGRHKNVGCYECHKENCTDPLAHTYCYQCHADPHQGAFIKKGRQQDCKSCHDLDGFLPSSYSISDHDKSSSPLTGAHRSTSCNSCHLIKDELKFKNVGEKCIDCHEDVHDGQISNRYYPENNCAFCHATENWQMVSFQHEATGFELTGQHLKQSCRACHFTSATGHDGQRFSSLHKQCINCHSDVHYGQFTSGGTIDCSRCHAFDNWQASRFDHDRTNFALDGRHRDVACFKCHFEVTESSRTFVKYKIESFRCEDCH